MKHLPSLIVLISSLYCCAVAALPISIVPQPSEIIDGGGTLKFNDAFCIGSVSGTADEYIIDRVHTGLGMQISRKGSGDCLQTIEFTKDSALSNEEYQLIIADNIEIIASNEAGFFYGAQSLLQLMPAEVYGDDEIETASFLLPKLWIKDKPTFEWRGFMLDISRHFTPLKELKEIVDQLAITKMNIFHLHLVDNNGWRIEVESYPKLHQMASVGNYSNPEGPDKYYLTKNEIRELVAYAQARYITLVPEIDMPGHSEAAAKAYPEYFDGLRSYNPANPETYTFVKTVLKEVMDLFPGAYMHFGGDEVSHGVRWDKLPEMKDFMSEQGLTTMSEVEGYFDRFVADYIVEMGKTPITWEEAVNFDINKQTVIQWWRGHVKDPVNLKKALSGGHQVILSPNWYVYLDYPQHAGEPGAVWNGNLNGPNSMEAIYNWQPLSNIEQSKQALVKGVEAPLWTEFVRSKSYREFMLYPRLAALAEVSWTQGDKRKLASFKERMTKHYQRYKASKVNYRKPGARSGLQYITH